MFEFGTERNKKKKSPECNCRESNAGHPLGRRKFYH
jgi:hypothetical protein